MTYAAAGSGFGNQGTGTTPASASYTSTTVGNFVLAVCLNQGTAIATGLSSTNATWTPLGSSFTGPNTGSVGQAFLGAVTSAATANVTATSGAGTLSSQAIVGQEFSSTTGTPVLDQAGHLDILAGQAAWPLLTPTTGGELYFGYAFNTAASTSGSTAGYVYNPSPDGNGNGSAYNLSCAGGIATGPVWGDSGQSFGLMLLVMPAPQPGLAVPPLPFRPGRTWKRRFSPQKQILQSPFTVPQPPYISALAGSGINGYFTDQYGKPKFLQLEMIWGLPCNAGRWNGSGGGTWQQDIDSYFNARGSQGAVSAWWGVPWINTTIDSAAVFADGRTWDGIFPFSLNGTPGTIATGTETVTLNDPFWQRIDYMLVAARRNGIAIFLNLGMSYDFTDTGAIFVHLSSAQANAIGAAVATRYPQASFPNLHWAFGDDTQSGAGAAITCETAFTQMLAGIQSAGDTRPIITMEQMLETDSHIQFSNGAAYVPGGFGITSATVNFCYSYFPWYIAVEESYTEATGPLLPVVMGDGPWYGDSQSGATDYTIRRFAWWALASGARGLDTTSGPSLAGATSLWKWTASAVGNLTTDPNGPWVTSVLKNVLAYYTSLPGWYKLIPDTGNVLVTAGRGSRTANPPAPSFDTPNYGDTDNYVAASRVADGSLAVIYSNSHFSITIDQTKMAAGYTATWVDPVSLATTAATPGSTFTSTPLGNNSAGNPDWVLVLQGTQGPPPLPVIAPGAATTQSVTW